MKTFLRVTVVVVAMSLGAHATAQPDAASAASAGAFTEAEVRKVDAAAATLTLRHGDIPHLDMPGMTMVFKVADPDMLTRVKAGDRVRFTADRVNGVLTVTTLQPAEAN